MADFYRGPSKRVQGPDPDPGPGRARSRGVWLVAALFALGGPVLLAGAFNAPRLDYDDKAIVEENPLAREGLTAGALEQVARPPLGGFRGYLRQYIPLTYLTLGLQWALHGPAWWAFRLVNLLLHLGSAVLLYQILLVLLPRAPALGFLSEKEQASEDGLTRRGRVCALLGAAFFYFHPTNVESVAWAAERNNVQGLFFALLAWRLLIVPSTERQDGRWLRPPSRRRFAWAVGAYACALLSKPSALGFAPFFCLAEGFWVRGPRAGRLLRAAAWLGLAGAAAYVGLQAGRADLQPVTGGGLGAWALTDFTLLGRYAAHTLVPWPLSFFYGVGAVREWDSPGLGLTALFLLGVLAVGLWLPIAGRSFWVLLGGALLALSPKLTPRTNAYLFQDRYLYFALPLAASLLALGGEAWAYRLRFLPAPLGRAMARTGLVTAGISCAALASLSLWRSFDFGASERLFRDAVEKQPQSYFAHYLLAQKLLELSYHEEYPAREARRLLKEAHLEILATHQAVDRERQNDPVEARLVEGEIEYWMHLPSARGHLEFVAAQATAGQVSLRSHARWYLAELAQRAYKVDKDPAQLEERRRLLEAILAEEPANAQVWSRLGETLESQGLTQEAVVAYRQALQDPRYAPQAAAGLARLEAVNPGP